MKVIFIGDIVGQPGRDTVTARLPELVERERPDFVVANGENAAGGKGLTGPIARGLFEAGIDVLTLGNHSFDRREIETVINEPRILRPANYPPGVPGHGWGIYTARDGGLVAVLSLMGRVYLPALDCPFRAASAALQEIHRRTRNVLVDFHAEITSEKQALGWYLDGRVAAVVGTHTHVPTGDEHILPAGTAYLTDAGMTGPSEGVIGMDREIIIRKYLTGVPQHFIVARGRTVMQGCIVDSDADSGKATGIRRFSIEGHVP